MDTLGTEAFRDDDFYELAERYFNPTRTYFRPSAVEHGDVKVPTEILRRGFDPASFAPYHNDETRAGISIREALANILEAQDEGKVDVKNLTIAPSITSASINVIFFLKATGFRQVLLETPCYYGTRFQLENIGLPLRLIPTYQEDDFQISSHWFGQSDTAYWVTHPRISLGASADKARLLSLLQSIAKTNSLLIVDEATELKQPPLLSHADFNQYRSKIIRLRSLLKPLAINGGRFAFIQHTDEISKSLKRFVWIAHGGIGRFSAETVFWVRDNPCDLMALKRATLTHCQETYNRMQTFLLGTSLSIPPYSNGFTTHIDCDLSLLQKSRESNKRIQLIKKLDNDGIFPTLGPSMYLAHRHNHEQIRINLLSNRYRLLNFVMKLSNYFR